MVEEERVAMLEWPWDHDTEHKRRLIVGGRGAQLLCPSVALMASNRGHRG